jgi:sugar lactone lactonase YvrE
MSKVMKQRWIGAIFLLSLLASHCVLLPDIPCQTDADCQNGGLGAYVCFRGLQCVPPWWRNKIEEQLTPSKDTGTPSESRPEPQTEPTDSPSPTEQPDANNCPSACTPGENRPCYSGKAGCTQSGNAWKCTGECKDGIQTCKAQPGSCPTWSACTGDTKPATETCDTKDNDCDGKIDEGCVVTIAGSGTGGLSDGKAIDAQLNLPFGLQFSPKGELYITEYPGIIRVLLPEGVISTFAGGPTSGFKNGKARESLFQTPSGIAIDASGNIYIADALNHRIRKIDKDGNVTTFAGTDQKGTKDGPRLQAEFDTPSGIALNSNGELFVVCFGSHHIRRIDTAGNVTTFAGSTKGMVDGKGTKAQFDTPNGLAIDASDNLYVADTNNHSIRKIDPQGNVTTIAGTGEKGDKDGPGKQAQFNVPRDVVIDTKGNIYVAGNDGHNIRKIDPQSNVTTIAGTGQPGFKDGPIAQAQFKNPSGITIGPNGHLYIADYSNHRIRKIILP